MKSFLKRNSSTILTCVGGVGVVATVALAIKETPKALTLLEQAEEEKGEELTVLETIKVAGPVYIPTVLAGTATIACIVGANVLNKRQQASMVSAYALLDRTYKDYKKKAIELYGEEANSKIVEEIAKDDYAEEDIVVEDNKQLFYDMFSRRYFESTMENVIHAEYEINKRLAVDSCVCLNEFYDLLGIPEIDGGDEVGWNVFKLVEETWFSWLDFNHEKVIMDDGLECIIITICYEPDMDFTDY